MKTPLLILSALLFCILFVCCTTIKVTAPDGTVTETKTVDRESLAIGAGVANNLIDRNSGK